MVGVSTEAAGGREEKNSPHSRAALLPLDDPLFRKLFAEGTSANRSIYFLLPREDGTL